MTAVRYKAAIGFAQISATLIAGPGQLQSFEQTNIGRELANFVEVIPKVSASLEGQALASIEVPVVIRKILNHLDETAIRADLLPKCRVPPSVGFLEAF